MHDFYPMVSHIAKMYGLKRFSGKIDVRYVYLVSICVLALKGYFNVKIPWDDTIEQASHLEKAPH